MIPHDAIRSVYRMKNYIVIISRAKMMHIFKNDCYSVGNAEELWVFLKKKTCEIYLKMQIMETFLQKYRNLEDQNEP